MLSRLKTALRALLRRTQVERELDEELRYHIEQQTEQNIRLGMNPAEASDAALKVFGGVEQAKELSRDTRGVRFVEELWQDLRFGVRMLRKNPGFALIAALMLALGIGANTAIFSLIDAVSLKSLPVKRPEELVSLSRSFSYPGIKILREYDQVTTGLVAFTPVRLGVSIAGQTEPAALGHLVSGNYFSVLGVRPAFGRLFGADDDRAPGAHPVAVISHSYWRRRFGIEPSILGKTISLAGMPFTIIGVTPPEFFGVVVGASPDIFAPVMMAPHFMDASQRSGSILEAIGYRNFNLFGRLKPGVTEAQAVAGLEAPFRRFRDELARYYGPNDPRPEEKLTVTS